ncbi:unnamed protein product, partial [Protopolystoma xenopodis]
HCSPEPTGRTWPERGHGHSSSWLPGRCGDFQFGMKLLDDAVRRPAWILALGATFGCRVVRLNRVAFLRARGLRFRHKWACVSRRSGASTSTLAVAKRRHGTECEAEIRMLLLLHLA